MTYEVEKTFLRITPEEAKQLNDEVEREPLIPGAHWYLLLNYIFLMYFSRYLITHNWWMRFMELKDNPGQSEYIQLPPINNESLIQQSLFKKIIFFL